jgi:hypothetical protein
MLPLHFFANPRYSAAIGALAMVLFALLGMFFLLTQYLQFCLGFSPLRTGLAIGPLAILILVAAPSSVFIVRRVGTKPVVAGGMLFIALGAGLLSRTTVHDAYGQALPALALVGLGVGLALAPSTESIMGSLPPAQAGVGSATSDTSMQVGGALGVAVLGTVLAFRFRDLISPLIAHQPVPPDVAKVIEGSLGGALAVAAQLPARYGVPLAASARRAFVSGMDLGFLVAALVVGAAGLVVVLLLPNRPSPSGKAPRSGR